MRQLGGKVKDNCIVVFSPAGMVNHDGDRSKGILGYHNEVLVPFGTFPSQYQFADTLSHEVAEMTVDPFVSHTNPEVCDGCAGNCNKDWKSFFAVNPLGGFTYLRSANGIPPAPFRSSV